MTIARHNTSPNAAGYNKALVAYRRRVGERLCRLREQAGFTQRALAKRVGVSAFSHINRIEAGGSSASPDLAKRLADALHEPALEVELLRARDPIPESVLVLLLKSPKLLARLEVKARKR